MSNSIYGKLIETVTLNGTLGSGVDYYKGDKGDKPVKGTDYWTDTDKKEIISEAVTEVGKGTKGDTGDSAYQIAVKEGFSGTEAEWITSLKGKDGYTPVKGTDYFTTEDIDTIATSTASKIDTSGYAKKTDLNSYSTTTIVDSKDSTILSSAKSYTDTKIAAIPVVDLTPYALKTSIPVVPTKVSAFTNDAGYLTQHQSLESYATKTYVDTAIEGIDIPVAPDLSSYATKTYVDTAVAGVSAPDLTPYALKTEIPDVSGKANSADLATVATSGSYTDLANKPTIPSVAGLASETYVNNAIAAIAPPDLSAYALKSELPTMTNYYTKTEIDATIGDIATLLAAI